MNPKSDAPADLVLMGDSSLRAGHHPCAGVHPVRPRGWASYCRCRQYGRAWIGVLLALSSSFAASYEEELNAGMAFHDEGKYDKAIAAYARASTQDPTNCVPLYEMAYSYSAKGAKDSAIAYGEASLRLQQKGNDAAYVLLGNVYDEMKRPAQADSVYTLGLRHNPESTLLYYNYAICKYGRGALDSALLLAKKGAAHSRTHESSYYMASVLSSQAGTAAEGTAYGLYYLAIARPSERASSLQQRFYAEWHGLARRVSKDSMVIRFSPDSSKHATDNNVFRLELALYAAHDSIGGQWIGSESVSRYDYLSYMGAKAIETIAESKTENDMKSFYADVVKHRFQVPFARYAFSGASRSEFSLWAKANAKQLDAFVTWFNQQAR